MTKVVLVTGAAGGMGSAVTKEFFEHGWRVVATDLRPPSEGPAAVEGYRFIRADLSSAEEIDAVVQTVETQENSLDCLVNVAGTQIRKPFELLTNEDARYSMSVNVEAPLWLSQAFAPLLRKNLGAIVNISSIHSLMTSSGMTVYAATKAALNSLTRSLALELAPEVRVNCVSPGAIGTEMLYDSIRTMSDGDDEDWPARGLDSLAAKHPLNRVGEPVEVARMAYVLADPYWSSFMTGAIVFVDGGAHAHLSTE